MNVESVIEVLLARCRKERRMVLAAVYIILFTLLAAACWHLTYRWFLSEGATSYESLLLTSVFQTMICLACFLTTLKEHGFSSEIRDNKRIEEVYMISAAGFFFHDTPHWQVRHTLTSYTLLLHHVVAFIFLMATLFFGKGGSFAVKISCYMEITTPLLAIRHYLKLMNINCWLVEILFAILFVALRFGLGADTLLSILQKEEVPPPFKVGIVIIYFMSCGLLPGVLRMALSSNRRPQRKESRQQSMVLQHYYATTVSRQTRSRTKSKVIQEEGL